MPLTKKATLNKYFKMKGKWFIMSQEGLSVALNSARETSSAEYQANVPVVDETTSIEVFSAPLLNVPRLFNEFADNLIQRIVYTQFFSKV